MLEIVACFLQNKEKLELSGPKCSKTGKKIFIRKACLCDKKDVANF